MTARWADELVETHNNYEPDPKLEPFYILAALEFGDPDSPRWLETNAVKFYQFWNSYQKGTNYPYMATKVILQYIFWYEHERPKEKI